MYFKDCYKPINLPWKESDQLGLENIKGAYDSTFSLGHLCLAAMQLRKFQLRPFSGVLDWVGSPDLTNVNRLLRQQFSDFLNPAHIKPIKYLSPEDVYVLDEVYNIGFNHDFKTDKNTLTHLGGFPEIKEKYDRRIKRFLEKMATSERILFIRTEGSFEEVQELESILSNMVKNDFRLLVVNHKDIDKMVEVDWPLAKTTVVELPDKEIWNENDPYWEKIFEGVTLK